MGTLTREEIEKGKKLFEAMKEVVTREQLSSFITLGCVGHFIGQLCRQLPPDIADADVMNLLYSAYMDGKYGEIKEQEDE